MRFLSGNWAGSLPGNSPAEQSPAAGDDAEEKERLDNVLCILQAMGRSLKHRPSAIQSTSNLDYLRSAWLGQGVPRPAYLGASDNEVYDAESRIPP